MTEAAGAVTPATAPGRETDVPAARPAAPRVAVRKRLLDGKARQTLTDGLWLSNPIAVQVLGICSSLAVTNRLENALVMGGALIFVTALSNLFVSLLRNTIPRKIRMIVEVAVISLFVILFDQFLRAFYWPMSKQLGPYVGLIITNCIVMGRAEAFALQNRPLLSVVDGAANGLGYAVVLAAIAVFRELAGSGAILGFTILPGKLYTPNQMMILAPGAFVTMGVLIAIFNTIGRKSAGEKKS